LIEYARFEYILLRESCSDEVTTILKKSIKSLDTFDLKGPSIFAWKSWEWMYSIGERFSSCGIIVCSTFSIIYLFSVCDTVFSSVIKLLELLTLD